MRFYRLVTISDAIIKRCCESFDIGTGSSVVRAETTSSRVLGSANKFEIMSVYSWEASFDIIKLLGVFFLSLRIAFLSCMLCVVFFFDSLNLTAIAVDLSKSLGISICICFAVFYSSSEECVEFGSFFIVNFLCICNGSGYISIRKFICRTLCDGRLCVINRLLDFSLLGCVVHTASSAVIISRLCVCFEVVNELACGVKQILCRLLCSFLSFIVNFYEGITINHKTSINSLCFLVSLEVLVSNFNLL